MPVFTFDGVGEVFTEVGFNTTSLNATLSVDISDDHMLRNTATGLETVAGQFNSVELSFAGGSIDEDLTGTSFDVIEAAQSQGDTTARFGIFSYQPAQNDTQTIVLFYDADTATDGAFESTTLYFALSGPDLTLQQINSSAGANVVEGPYALGVDFALADSEFASEITEPVPVVDTGTDGDDTIEGGDAGDTLVGGDGDDNIDGGGGDDQIAAGSGNDVIEGGPGDDNIGGGTEGDVIRGNDGNDTIGSGAGDDSANGGNGNDVVNGGQGDDNLAGGNGDDTMGASFGNDTVIGNAGDDSLGGGTGRDVLTGGDGADSIGGGEGDDSITGDAGNDFLAGGGRDDSIDGGTGDDRINAGDGDDTITGGEGADVFVFNRFNDGDSDVITDWTNGEDVFRLPAGQPGVVADLLDSATTTNGGVLLTIEGHEILLLGADIADLGTEDFL